MSEIEFECQFKHHRTFKKQVKVNAVGFPALMTPLDPDAPGAIKTGTSAAIDGLYGPEESKGDPVSPCTMIAI